MPPFFKTKLQITNMSLELKNVEKKVGIETHIHSTNLKLEKNTINVLLGSTLANVDPNNTLIVFFSNLRFVE